MFQSVRDLSAPMDMGSVDAPQQGDTSVTLSGWYSFELLESVSDLFRPPQH